MFDCYQPSQVEMQRQLEDLHRTSGLATALNELYRWSVAVGYISEEEMLNEPSYDYWDELFKISFRAKLNAPLRDRPIEDYHSHCQICYENMFLPGFEKLRAYELDFPNGRRFFFQLTPYPLYPKHFVIVDREPVPMKVHGQSIADMAFLVEQLPDFVVCSNSDVEWSGASILQHQHYQAVEFLNLPIMQSSFIDEYTAEGRVNCAEVKYGILDFPAFSARVESFSAEAVVEIGDRIIQQWKNKMPLENTCNLILHRVDGLYQLYLLFRNPKYRTPPDLRVYKDEALGVFEMAGMGLFPASQEFKNIGLSRFLVMMPKLFREMQMASTPLSREHYAEFFKELTRLQTVQAHLSWEDATMSGKTAQVSPTCE